MKKINLDVVLKEEQLSEEVEKRLKLKLVYIPIIQLVLVLIAFMFFIVNIDKVNTILILYGNSNFLGKSLVIIVFLSIILAMVSLSSKLIYTIYNIYKVRDWKKSYCLFKKLDIIEFILKCVTALSFIVCFVITPCNVSGDSMNDTLKDNDKLLCYSLFYEPKKDDIVIFSAQKITNENELYIKRVIALEDDLVSYDIVNNKLLINNEEVATITSKEYSTIYSMLNEEDMNLYIPKDKVLVLGDNRNNSYDSRSFGLIDEDDIIGCVFLRVYPFKSIEDIILE